MASISGLSSSVLLVLVAFGKAVWSETTSFQSPTAACLQFAEDHLNSTFSPATVPFIEASTEYYSESSWLSPACIFQPNDSDQVAYAVKKLVSLNTPFAIRGGGHMPITGAANINSSGVLISNFGLKQLSVSADKSTVNVGPGNVWDDVYKFLEEYGLSVVGGHLGPIGVPGLVLGGGVSFFSSEYGWASANVASFTVVLADGTIVKAAPCNKYSDLFWALRGGGNSFGIVTNFELKTLQVPAVTVGSRSYSSNVTATQFLDSVYNFVEYGSSDEKTAIIPTALFTPVSSEPTLSTILFHNGDDPAPAALVNFSAPVMVPTSSTFSYRSMYNWTQEMNAEIELLHGFRQRFYVLTIHSNREAFTIVYNTWADAVASKLSSLGIYIFGLTFQPITKQFVSASTVNGGDPQGLDVDGAPYVFVEQSLGYDTLVDDATVDAIYNEVDANITQQLKAKGFKVPSFLYLNDANVGQPVFQGYPAENLANLQSIRAKYDRSKVYTNLLPGGWKVDGVLRPFQLLARDLA